MLGFRKFLMEIAAIRRGFPRDVETYSDTGYFETNTSHPEKNILKPGAEPLTNDEIRAIRTYTSDKYNEMNTVAKTRINKVGNKSMSWYQFSRTRANNKHLSSAIGKHQTVKDMYVYRGFEQGGPNRMQGPTQPGKDYLIRTMRGFASTSMDHHRASNFGEMTYNPKNQKSYIHVVKIHVPAGSHGIFVNKVSEHPSEREFLIAPGAQIAISKKFTVNNIRRRIT